MGTKGERGFLLLGVLTTILLLGILSGAVVQEWSIIERREREAQLIFVQEQYAAAILEYQKGQGALPTELKQLEAKGQTGELYLRQMFVDPMTRGAKLEDWCLLQINAGGQIVSSCAPEGTPEGTPQGGLQGGFGGASTLQPGQEPAGVPGRASGGVPGRASGGAAAGQSGVVGVHSKSTETAYNMKKFDEETYNLWAYTIESYKADIASRNIPGMPPRGGPGLGQKPGQAGTEQQPGSPFAQPDPFNKGRSTSPGSGSKPTTGGSNQGSRRTP